MWAKLRNNTNILINHPYFIFKTTGMIFYKKFLKKIHACEIHFFYWWSSLEANGWCCFILEIRKATLTMDLQDDRRNSFFKMLFWIAQKHAFTHTHIILINERISKSTEGLLYVVMGGTDGGNHCCLGVSSQTLLQKPENIQFIFKTLHSFFSHQNNISCQSKKNI